MSTPASPLIVLAAVDYSELSTTVLQQALGLVRLAPSAELHCLHVNHDVSNEDVQEARRKTLMEWLGTWLAGAGEIPESVQVIAHQARGEPIQVILETASDLSADLVVVGTHDPKGIDRLLMGSVAEAVVRKAGCPVVVVRPKAHAKTSPHVEPSCARCVEVRRRSQGSVYWCEQHAEKHGRRHGHYHPGTRTWSKYRFLI
jgi:nucleotide-binding universal stress UspA family protein